MFPSCPPEVLDLLRTAGEVIIIGHKDPDGDCLYSTLALAELLRGMGKPCLTVNSGPFDKPETASAAPSFVTSVGDEVYSRDPLLVVLDCSSMDRTGDALDAAKAGKLRTVIIDHHGSFEQSDAAAYRVPQSVSTTLLILQIAGQLGAKLTKEFARYVLRGFLTDSGCFRFLGKDQGDQLTMVADLIGRFNLSINFECESLFSHDDRRSCIWLSRLLGRTAWCCGGSVALSYVTEEDIREFDGIASPSSDYYARVMKVEGIKVAVLLRFEDENSTSIGLRSTHMSNFDVGSLAQNFPHRISGGGHFHAAGGLMGVGLEQAVPVIIGALEAALG